MNENIISQIIAKKTNLYLKFSMVLFVLSLILLSSAFLFVQQQYVQSSEDFINNANTHIINIYNKNGFENNNIIPLTFSDEQKIQKISNRVQASYVYTEYSIGFGISDENDNIYFIKGIDNEIVKHFNMEEIKPNEAVVNPQVKKQSIVLRVPHIDVKSGGFTSNITSNINLNLIPAFNAVTLFEDFDTSIDTIFVNTETLQKIVSMMYGITWEEFKTNYDLDNPYGIQIIESINVYIEDLKNVNDVAKDLKNSGYCVNYVLGAFNDLQNSLAKTHIIYGLLLFFILIITAVNIVISFRGYLYSMQKDIGILKHYGYSQDRVYNVYKVLIMKPYIKILVLTTIYILILSLILFQSQFFKAFILAFILILIFVSVVLLILLKSLNTLCKKDIIVLLKQSKEVE